MIDKGWGVKMNYSIGEISKALNVSVQAIRLYQRKGLIKPTFIDPKSKYRYFDSEEASKIWRVKILQSAGMSLKEINDLDHLVLDDIETVLRNKREQLEISIQQKQLALNYLDRQLSGIELFKEESDVKVIEVEDRYGVSFSSGGSSDLFEHLKELSAIEGRMGLNLEVSYLPSIILEYNNKDVDVKTLFAIREQEFEGCYIQKGGTYLSKFLKGGKDLRAETLSLISYANEKGYTPRGDTLVLLVINNNLINSSEYNVVELQLAVVSD